MGGSGFCACGQGVRRNLHGGLVLRAGAEGHCVGVGGGFHSGVHGGHHRAGGNGGAGQRVNVFAQDEGRGLADELLGEGRILHAAGAEAGGFAGGLDGQTGDRAGGVHGQLHLDVGGKALGGAFMNVAGEGHLFHGLLFRHAENQHGLGALDAQDAAHRAQGGVGSAQHGVGGEGRAGQGFDGAALLQVDADELLGLVFRQPAGAEAGGFGEVGVTDLGAGDLAVHADAQGDRHGAGIAAGGCHHAVTDGFAILPGLHQGRDAAAVGDGHFDIFVSGHHRAEGLALGGHGMLLDGALGQGVGPCQGQRGDQTDDRQHQKRGQLLLVGHGCCLLTKHQLIDEMGYPLVHWGR